VQDTTSDRRDRRLKGATGDGGVPKLVGAIVIVAVLVLAAQAGGLRNFVNH